jgi:hypothetical protein
MEWFLKENEAEVKNKDVDWRREVTGLQQIASCIS